MHHYLQYIVGLQKKERRQGVDLGSEQELQRSQIHSLKICSLWCETCLVNGKPLYEASKLVSLLGNKKILSLKHSMSSEWGEVLDLLEMDILRVYAMRVTHGRKIGLSW